MRCRKQRLYSMTSSARTSSVCGTVRPRAAAVLRLTARWIFVGCSNGRSAGLAPPQDLIDVNSGDPEEVRQILAVANEPASLCVLPIAEQGRQPMLDGQLRKLRPLAEEKASGATINACTSSRRMSVKPCSISSIVRASTRRTLAPARELPLYLQLKPSM